MHKISFFSPVKRKLSPIPQYSYFQNVFGWFGFFVRLYFSHISLEIETSFPPFQLSYGNEPFKIVVKEINITCRIHNTMYVLNTYNPFLPAQAQCIYRVMACVGK